MAQVCRRRHRDAVSLDRCAGHAGQATRREARGDRPEPDPDAVFEAFDDRTTRRERVHRDPEACYLPPAGQATDLIHRLTHGRYRAGAAVRRCTWVECKKRRQVLSPSPELLLLVGADLCAEHTVRCTKQTRGDDTGEQHTFEESWSRRHSEPVLNRKVPSNTSTTAPSAIVVPAIAPSWRSLASTDRATTYPPASRTTPGIR